jgi:hypothetical protein
MNGTGSGTVRGDGISCGTVCNETSSRGHAVTLTAVAASDSTVAGWSGCDTTNGASCTISLNADRAVVAFFELLASPSTLTVTKSGTGSGTVTGSAITCGSHCSATLASGTSIALTAAAASGATFTGWIGCDATSSETCTMSMTENKTVTAVFDGNCTPDATRCVGGNIEVQERCNAAGSWTQESCGAWQLCAAGACHVACGMTFAPVDPTLCVLAIADGVNDGEWLYWNDAAHISSPTYAEAGTVTRFRGSAEVLPAPEEEWPFMWRLRANDDVIAAFRLDQFGPYRHPRFGYRTREAGVQTSTADGFKVAIFNSTDIVRSCISLTTTMWTAGTCSAETPYNQALDYARGANGIELSNSIGLVVEKHEGVIDLLDVNYAYLTIAP